MLFAELFLEALSLATVVIVVAIVFRHAGVVLGALVGVVGAYAGFVIGVARDRRPPRRADTWTTRRRSGRFGFGLGGKRWDDDSALVRASALDGGQRASTSSFAGPRRRTSCR